MIDIICGLIGSGKSTYALGKYNTVIECEDGDKGWQLQRARNALDGYAYITCWPTLTEREYFSSRPSVRYIWINTSESQAEENIYRRGRTRDLANINEVLRKNKELSYKAAHTDIRFTYIDVFQTGEKW